MHHNARLAPDACDSCEHVSCEPQQVEHQLRHGHEKILKVPTIYLNSVPQWAHKWGIISYEGCKAQQQRRKPGQKLLEPEEKIRKH